MMNKNSAIAMFDRHNQAEDAVKQLQQAGFNMMSLSIIGKDFHTDEHVVGYYTTSDRMRYWGKNGDFRGGIWGMLFGSAFKRNRESMATLTPWFSASQTVCEYTETHHLPAARAYLERSANKGEIGKHIVDCKRRLGPAWDTLRFGEVKVETRDAQHQFEIQVVLDGLDPNNVRVEFYADGINGETPRKMELKQVRQMKGIPGGYVYHAAISSARPDTDYTARILPHCPGVSIPLEDPRIRWQH